VPSFSTSPSVIAKLLGDAPTLARLGLAAPNERVRERAAQDLANYVTDRLDLPPRSDDVNQLALPL
jgi:hypothetical protein